ncbi:hypothetical protein [Rheinheimera soli]|uniref:hypothetical protein n=1 Tax=Rheinheimera soli TaxID=443616 RepID=UPI001E63B1BF|nr:hypothetical protein [Rheinheimera soli]
MHLDLSNMLPSQAISDIENIALTYKDCCRGLLWFIWVRELDTNRTSINILQAGAQLLASYDCVIAALRFGLYCSRYFSKHGSALSDDVALYYLRLSFSTLENSSDAVIEWVRKAEGFDFPDGLKDEFWIQACAAYVQHEYDNSPDYLDSTIDFAMSFLIND